MLEVWTALEIENVLKEDSRLATGSVFAGGEVVVIVFPTSDLLLLLLFDRGGLQELGVLGAAFDLGVAGGGSHADPPEDKDDPSSSSLSP